MPFFIAPGLTKCNSGTQNWFCSFLSFGGHCLLLVCLQTTGPIGYSHSAGTAKICHCKRLSLHSMILCIRRSLFGQKTVTVARLSLWPVSLLPIGLVQIPGVVRVSRKTGDISRGTRNPGVSQCLGFVQLIFGPHWPMNQLNKNPNIALLQDSWHLWTCQKQFWKNKHY